jgi:hypothetical protein
VTVNTWPPWSVTSLKHNLDQLAELLAEPKVRTLDPDIQPWLSRLLVVRTCGYLEQVAAEVCRYFINGRSGGLVRVFASSWMERSRNPSPENLLALIGRFDADMSYEFESMLNNDDGRLKRELSLLVDRRNKIAHGLSEGITPSKALQLKDVAYELADWFILRFNPGR